MTKLLINLIKYCSATHTAHHPLILPCGASFPGLRAFDTSSKIILLLATNALRPENEAGLRVHINCFFTFFSIFKKKKKKKKSQLDP